MNFQSLLSVMSTTSQACSDLPRAGEVEMLVGGVVAHALRPKGAQLSKLN